MAFVSYQPQTFPMLVPPNWRTDRDVIRSNGTKCLNSKSLQTYLSRGQRWPVERPILYDNFAEMRGESQHGALDINCAWGTPVVSPRAGHVLTVWIYQGERRPGAGFSEKGGWYVWIEDDLGFKHYFAHMASEPLVRPGETVKAGQLIGYCGNTGNAEGGCAHLHYAVTAPNGQKFNPFQTLDRIYTAGGWRGTPLGWNSGGGVLLLLAAVGLGTWWLTTRTTRN